MDLTHEIPTSVLIDSSVEYGMINLVISEYLMVVGDTGFRGESFLEGRLGRPNPSANPIGVHQAYDVAITG